jgi:hypothetical protein
MGHKIGESFPWLAYDLRGDRSAHYPYRQDIMELAARAVREQAALLNERGETIPPVMTLTGLDLEERLPGVLVDLYRDALRKGASDFVQHELITPTDITSRFGLRVQQGPILRPEVRRGGSQRGQYLMALLHITGGGAELVVANRTKPLVTKRGVDFGAAHIPPIADQLQLLDLSHRSYYHDNTFEPDLGALGLQVTVAMRYQMA